MQLTQQKEFLVPREQVWEAITDARILGACIPGCHSLEQVSPTRYEIRVISRLGPAQVNFAGTMMMEDLNPPVSYTLVAIGKGGAAGVARGEAQLHLDPTVVDGREGTLLTYTIHARLGGKLGQLAAGLVAKVAARMANHFIEQFTQRLTQQLSAAASEPFELPGQAD